MDRRAHWERVYRTKGPEQVSWFQAEARLSRELIEQVAPNRAARIIDIGAGASTLVDGLLAAGYQQLTMVDLSGAALRATQDRLGTRAAGLVWKEADVLATALDAEAYDVWHDRAVFHFLTAATDRANYVKQVRHAVRRGGFVLVATFAEDGPMKCSGLDVVRYSVDALHDEFGHGFRLVAGHREEHTTPSGASQAFTYCVCQREP